MSRDVQDQIGLYSDPALASYVAAVGERLVAALEPGPYTFRFHIVDQAEPNAFAAPGGYIYISSAYAFANVILTLAGTLIMLL